MPALQGKRSIRVIPARPTFAGAVEVIVWVVLGGLSVPTLLRILASPAFILARWLAASSRIWATPSIAALGVLVPVLWVLVPVLWVLVPVLGVLDVLRIVLLRILLVAVLVVGIARIRRELLRSLTTL